MEYKFKVGDKVKIVKCGLGCNPSTIGEIVTIAELGIYNKKAGYKIDNNQIQTNSKSGSYDGYIGEMSFELVERQTFYENDIVVCLPKPLQNPGDAEPNMPGGAGYRTNLCFRVTSTNGNNIAWNNARGVYFPSLRHATKEEEQKYYDLGKPYITTEEIFERKPNRFNIGDIVDTNKLGWQYINMKVCSQNKIYNEQVIFVDCGCRTQVLKNIKILDVVYSPYTKCWWYELEGFSNWYSEHGLVEKEKEESGSVIDLLEEAKRRYPVGTKYKCANNVCSDSIVQKQSVFQYYGDEKDKIDILGSGFIYYKGKWAEIISTPDLDEKTKLQEKEEILQNVNSKNYHDCYIETFNPCAEIQISPLTEVKKVPVIQNKKIEILRKPVLNKRQKKIKKTNKINLIIK